MKKLVLTVLVSGLVMATFCQQPITAKKVDSLLQTYSKLDKFTGSVLIAQNGKILLERGYGFKNVKSGEKNNSNTIFRIYSITKIFTSTLILKLSEEGKLSLQDKLNKYYPGFPSGNSISIIQLLSHTAGVYDYTHGNDMKEQSEAEMIRFLKTKKLDFSPGTNWSYSNSGYWLLGFIIEKTAQMSYGKALEKYIFQPAGMRNSGLDFKLLNNKNRATGYASTSAERSEESVIYDPPGPYAAGAIHSTVGDLYRFAQAMNAGKIISLKDLSLAQTGVMRDYGLGWIINKYDGHKTVSHSGGGAGFHTDFMMIPDENLFVTILSNSESVNSGFVMGRILDLLHGKSIKIPAEIKLPETALEKFTGTFKTVDPELIFYIGIENSRLRVQVSRNPVNIVFAQTPTKFYAEEPDASIEFLKDSTEHFNIIEVIQRDRKISGKRIFPAWGIVGDATAGGWDSSSDLQLIQDSQRKELWYGHGIELMKGEIKFRFNNDWTISYGIGKSAGQLEPDGGNISVEAGTYDIELNLKTKTFSLMKK